jgi:aminoglycoside 6'-N-acetyltransferase I
MKQAASLLVTEFAEVSPQPWPNLKSGMKEVAECTKSSKICRGVIDHHGNLIGWIGSMEQYKGYTWELHPIVVNKEFWKMGIGTKLLKDIEKQVKRHGGRTIYLGTDDELNKTSLSGKNLYKNLLQEIQNIQNVKGHPYEFFQRNGYVIVGVIPDANGIGKPDIIMAKRIGD